MPTEKTLDTANAAEFHTQTDDVFARIATRYDLLSDLFSFGIHRLWKGRVAALIAAEPWTNLLDAAAGTGDVVLRVARQNRLPSSERTIVASDICPQMLAIARQRAIRPGGRVVALEASNLKWRWLQRAYLAYMRVCMPVIGWAATGGDASAYRYLLKGIEEFPSAEVLADELVELGFEDVKFERLSLGIVAIHMARKPRA